MDNFDLDYLLEWTLPGNPFLTPRGELVDAVLQAIRKVAGCDSGLSTSGGTSDRRFIAPTGAQVMEPGRLDAAHSQN